MAENERDEIRISKRSCESEKYKTEKMTLTLVIKKGKNGFLIGQLKEIPAVFTQGLTVDEVKENIIDSLDMYLEDIRENYHPEGEMLLEEELTFA